MTTKLKAAPDNPDGTCLPGDLVRVEVLAEITRQDGKPLTDAETQDLWTPRDHPEPDLGIIDVWWDDDFGAPPEVGAASINRQDLEWTWHEVYGAQRIPRARGTKGSNRCDNLVELYGYCREEDAPAMLRLLARDWHVGNVLVTPLEYYGCPVAWLSRISNDNLDDYWSDETFEGSRRPSTSAARIAELTEIADMVGNNATWFSKLANPAPTPPAPRFLVEGLVPIGNVTLLAAARKVGKSTLLTELAVTVAQRGGQWCGFTVPKAACNGFAVYLAGEDTDEVHARINAQDPLGRPARLIVPPRSGKPLGDLLDEISTLAIALLVVDPARAFMIGDEDSSDAGNTFFRQIADFVQAKQCAAIVAQHLKKDAAPRTINEIPGYVRGTGVFLDRPRVILGMVRAGEHTLIGIPAPTGDPLHNFRQSIMFSGQRRLTRDEATMRHLPADQGAVVDTAANYAVLAAVRRLNAEGRPVSRTGKSGIYEIGPEEIRGFSRQKVRAAADALIDAGKLLDNSGELIAAAPRAA